MIIRPLYIFDLDGTLLRSDGSVSARTRAALAGGNTTVIDFATQFHGETLARGLERWHEKAAGKAVTDYAFHLAMTQWQPSFAAELADMVEAGVTSFKLYLAYRHSMMVEDDEVLAALQAVDYVVPFDDDTPKALIEAVTPHVLAKGEDWRDKGVGVSAVCPGVIDTAILDSSRFLGRRGDADVVFGGGWR